MSEGMYKKIYNISRPSDRYLYCFLEKTNLFTKQPIIFIDKQVGFLKSYIACNERPITFDYATLQRYFLNIQRHKTKKNIKTFIHDFKSFIQPKSMQYSK